MWQSQLTINFIWKNKLLALLKEEGALGARLGCQPSFRGGLTHICSAFLLHRAAPALHICPCSCTSPAIGRRTLHRAKWYWSPLEFAQQTLPPAGCDPGGAELISLLISSFRSLWMKGDIYVSNMSSKLFTKG